MKDGTKELFGFEVTLHSPRERRADLHVHRPFVVSL